MIATLCRRLLAQRTALFALAFLAFLVVLSAAAPIIAPQNPADPLGFDPLAANRGPVLSWTYLLGADARGRSVLASLIWGGRLSLLIGPGAALLAAAVGLFAGLVTALRRGIAGLLVRRLLDLVDAVPPLLPALILFGRLGNLNAALLIAIFAATGWAAAARIALSAADVMLGSAEIEAALSVGVRGWRLLAAHLLPEAAAAVLIWSAQAAARYTALECGLDFMHLGLDSSSTSWVQLLPAHRMRLRKVIGGGLPLAARYRHSARSR